MNKYIELGSISGFFGVKGWVKLYSHTRPRTGISQYKHFFMGEAKQPVRFAAIKASGKNVVGHIDGVDSRESAERYLGQTLYITHEALPALDNEYYWHELIGLKVINQQGVLLGEITEMMETGANDVMVIQGVNGEVLIPYVFSHFVLSVDLDKGEMLVDWEEDEEGSN